MPDELPDYPHHTEIKGYLEEYADAFGLQGRIRFGNGVEQAARSPAAAGSCDQDGDDARFDVLVVANGHHWDPRCPDFPGAFAGEIIHSHAYIDPTEPLDLKGRRILVVGIGNSAADIVSRSPRSPGRTRSSVDPLGRVGRAEVRLRQARRHACAHRCRASRCHWQRRDAGCPS